MALVFVIMHIYNAFFMDSFCPFLFKKQVFFSLIIIILIKTE